MCGSSIILARTGTIAGEGQSVAAHWGASGKMSNQDL